VKTNAARILEGLHISYKISEYQVDESDLSAEAAAHKLGMPVEQVFKTLVVRGDKNGVLMVCIPGAAELDLKALAAVSRNKKVEMVHLKEVQPLTGYIRGGVSPIGAKKNYPVYVDTGILQWAEVSVSAGVRGKQIILSPADLIRAVNAQMGALVRSEDAKI